VWTKYVEGRSRHSQVIDRKQKGFADRPTDRHVQSNMPFLLQRGV